MAASVMFSMTGVDKQKFIEHVKTNPQTYKDWESAEWSVETSGKEDDMFSPFLRKPFVQARESGLIPANLDTIAGTWGAIYDIGGVHRRDARGAQRGQLGVDGAELHGLREHDKRRQQDDEKDVDEALVIHHGRASSASGAGTGSGTIQSKT